MERQLSGGLGELGGYVCSGGGPRENHKSPSGLKVVEHQIWAYSAVKLNSGPRLRSRPRSHSLSITWIHLDPPCFLFLDSFLMPVPILEVLSQFEQC